MSVISGGPGKAVWWDKVPSKFDGWSDTEFRAAGFRAVPGAVVRRSAFIAPNVVLMPSFVNLGAYVDAGTMVDTWATVGSCAQIGKHVHLSGGVGIGGVLEPLQAGPVIIEDNCFIGARSEVVEGVIVREGAVLGMGVYLGQSTKIVDRATGKIFYGEVPPYSVVVSGTLPGNAMPGSNIGPSLYCAVIVKRVDEKTRSKTSINDLLRDLPMAGGPGPLTRDLIRCPSVTPAEGGALAYLESVLTKAGFRVSRMTFQEPGAEDVENLYARIGDSGPNLVFAGHTDVVPPGDETAWVKPPFSGEIVKNELIGRGAVDMKGGIACALAATLDHLAANGG